VKKRLILVAATTAGLALSGAVAYAAGESTAPCTTGSTALCTSTETGQLGSALSSLADRYYKQGRADQAAVPTPTVTVTVTATPSATTTSTPTPTATSTTTAAPAPAPSFVVGTT
jgi:hypothetical protein